VNFFAKTAARAAFSLAMVAAVAASEPSGATASRLDEAQQFLYSGEYEHAAALALAARVADGGNLAASELRSTALLFQIRRVFGTPEHKKTAWTACQPCQALLSEFLDETNLGRAAARARIAQDPADREALFFLAKLHLNDIWLQLGTLGRRAGWREYWEARRTLDALLAQDPQHVRARVARAWIDYIVDTRVPRGTKWLLGGGDRKRGLRTLREAAEADGSAFARAEARFALWDMLVRERQVADAVATARTLSLEFPGNRELAKFLETHDYSGSR